MTKRFTVLLPATFLIFLLVSCDSADRRQQAAATPPPAVTAPTIVTPPPPPPPQSPPPPQPQAPKPDPVAQLIERVEKEYQAGQANYVAGHLEAAKQNFDRAFNLLTESKLDVQNEPRLQQEFDKIVNGIHDLEMVALKQGDGFTEQRLQPAPIDEANDVTFPVDPRIKAQAEAEIKQTHSDLPLVLNDTVASYINYYSTRGHGTVERALVRAGRYRDMIQRVLKEEGVPQDLIYLAQAESGFQPLAISRASARGMWQFMASRASSYGLRRDWWVDERQDPEKSTRAAARHLKDLYREFGDWYLALAAYNSGPGTVQAGVQRTGYADFWELYRRDVLPKETKNYVPIILAFTIMSKNPVQYGLDALSPEPALAADVVTLDYPVDLRLAAECVDAAVETLQDLNPALLRMTTPREGTFELRLPAGTKDKYLTNIAAIPPDMRTWWRYHRVAPGDTLTEIAKRYHTTTKAIVDANDLRAEDPALDARLIIPVTPGRDSDSEVRYSKATVRYRVRAHDTVLSVADEWGVTPEALRKWNHLSGNHLTRGRRLIIHRPLDVRNQPLAGEKKGSRKSQGRRSTTASKSQHSNTLQAASGNSAITRRVTHRVKPGETLYGIARRYNTSVAALQRQNGANAAHLKPGTILIISAAR